MTEINNIKFALRLCDYCDQTFRQVEKVREKKDQLKTKNPKSEPSIPLGKLAVLPCVKDLLEMIARFVKTVSFRMAHSIEQQLFKLKDKAHPLKMTNTGYKVGCNK